MQKRKDATRENRQWMFLSLVGVLVVLFLCTLLTHDKVFSEQENRPLAQKPAWSWDTLRSGVLTTEFETYWSDQIIGRNRWIGLHNRKERLVGRKDSDGVLLGKGGQLFAEPVTPDEEKQTRSIEAIKSFTERHEKLPFSILLVPDAATILTDRLPAGAPIRDQAADIRSYLAKIRGSNVQCPEVTEALSQTEEPFYHTDHHWTSDGAYQSFLAAAPVLSISDPVAYRTYLVSENFQGTLASRAGNFSVQDKIFVYAPAEPTDLQYYVNFPEEEKKTTSLFFREKLEEKDQYTLFLGGNHGLVEIGTNRETERRLLILKDSYANSFVQFLLPYYDTILLIDPRYYYGDLEAEMQRYEINEVLLLYSADILFQDTALADTLLAEAPGTSS